MSQVRVLVTLLACAVAASSCGQSATASAGGNPRPSFASSGPREQTADQQVSHVLSRLTFGARPSDADRVRSMGVDRWMEEQLHPERIPDAAADAFFGSYETYHRSPDELEQKYPRPQKMVEST